MSNGQRPPIHDLAVHGQLELCVWITWLAQMPSADDEVKGSWTSSNPRFNRASIGTDAGCYRETARLGRERPSFTCEPARRRHAIPIDAERPCPAQFAALFDRPSIPDDIAPKI